MNQILDQFGRPLRLATRTELLEEQSGPMIGTVRGIERSHPAEGLEPLRLASILRASETGDAETYLDLAEQMEEKDLHYAAVLGVRKRAIRGLELIVEPGDDSDAAGEAADLVRKAVEGAAIKEDYVDMLDALGKGYSVCEIIWDQSGPRWEIVALDPRPPGYFEFDRTNGRHLRLRGTAEGQQLSPDKYVIHLSRAKSGLPIRAGLARLAAWAYMFKNFAVKDWSIFLEAYGHPLRLGKYDPALASPEDKRTLLRAARSIGIDMAAVIPKNMEMEVIAAKSNSNEGYEKAARWWDEQLSKGILGQVATTDAIAGGHAVGNIHEAVREDIRDADADQLAITLMRDIARPLVRHNLGEAVPVPRLRFQPPELVDPDRLLKLMEVAGPAGLRIAKSDIYKAFSLRQPDDADDVLVFAPPVSAGRNVVALPPVRTRQLAAAEHAHADPVRDLIDQLIGDGRMAGAVRSEMGTLVDAIHKAASFEDIEALLDRAGLDAPGPAMRELLARGMFAARLSGEMGG